MARSTTKPRAHPDLTERFEELSTVGPVTAADFRLLGAKKPADLVGRDPEARYARLCELTRSRQDPCVLDLFWRSKA